MDTYAVREQCSWQLSKYTKMYIHPVRESPCCCSKQTKAQHPDLPHAEEVSALSSGACPELQHHEEEEVHVGAAETCSSILQNL